MVSQAVSLSRKKYHEKTDSPRRRNVSKSFRGRLQPKSRKIEVQSRYAGLLLKKETNTLGKRSLRTGKELVVKETKKEKKDQG